MQPRAIVRIPKFEVQLAPISRDEANPLPAGQQKERLAPSPKLALAMTDQALHPISPPPNPDHGRSRYFDLVAINRMCFILCKQARRSLRPGQLSVVRLYETIFCAHVEPAMQQAR